jgi:SMC interacting uncharacterized protein involved in chromosome segregation
MANISNAVKEVIKEMVDNDELKIKADDYGDLVLEVNVEPFEDDEDEDDSSDDYYSDERIRTKTLMMRTRTSN